MSQFSNAGRYWPPALTLLALSLAGLARADDETIEIARIGGGVGDGAQFGSFLEPSINSVGLVVFNARLTGPGTDAATNSGIYRALVTDVNLPVLGGVQQVLRESTTLDAGGLVFNPRDLFLSRVYLKDPNLPEGIAVPVSGDFGRIALQLPVLGTVSLVFSERQRTERRMELGVFALTLIGLIAVYGGLVTLEAMHFNLNDRISRLIEAKS